MRYRLDVVAADVADVVRFAGGWLFDRAMAGWDVTVLVADHPDERPLRILGAADHSTSNTRWRRPGTDRPRRPWPPRLTCSAATRASGRASCRRSIRVPPRSRCGDKPGRPNWMTASAWSSTGSARRLRHSKAQALAAAGIVAGPVGPIETFRSRVMSGPSVEADLVPAG